MSIPIIIPVAFLYNNILSGIPAGKVIKKYRVESKAWTKWNCGANKVIIYKFIYKAIHNL